jgi:hypothetical protein
MEEALPTATLTGMSDPRTWTQHIAAHVPLRPPCAPARWLTPKDCLAALQWHQPFGCELVTVLLIVHTDHVEIGVWTTTWSDDQVGYGMYCELVITVATLIIDQYADQDGPPVQLHVQPYDETQAPLKELE